MKKTDVIPCTCNIGAEVDQMLATIGVISNNNDINIGYGGVDTDGSQDPSVKEGNFDYEWDF